MITLETLNNWSNAATENERLEFKEAKNQYDINKLMRYCVADRIRACYQHCCLLLCG
jgi:ATP-dependent DNA helicase RecG